MSIYSLMQPLQLKKTGFVTNFAALVLSTFFLNSCGPDAQLVGDMMEVQKKQLQAQPKIDELSLRIKTNPKDVDALLERAALYTELARIPLAQRDYALVVKIDPKNAAGYIGRGKLSYGQPDAQLADFNQALKLDPTNADAFLARGTTYYGSSRFKEAESDLVRGLKAKPHDFTGNWHLGSVYRRLKNNDKAIEYYSRAIAEHPDDVRVYEDRASTYSSLDRYEDAVKDATKIIELRPKDAHSYSDRAAYYNGMGKYLDALHDLNKAISIDGSRFWFYRQRASIYRELGDDKKANDDEYTAEHVAKESAASYGKLLGE